MRFRKSSALPGSPTWNNKLTQNGLGVMSSEEAQGSRLHGQVRRGGRRVGANLRGRAGFDDDCILEMHAGRGGTQRSKTLSLRKATVGLAGQTPFQHPSSQNQARGGEEQGQTSSTDVKPQGTSV